MRQIISASLLLVIPSLGYLTHFTSVEFCFDFLLACLLNFFPLLITWFQHLENYNEAARLFQTACTSGDIIRRFTFNQMLRIYGKLKVFILIPIFDEHIRYLFWFLQTTKKGRHFRMREKTKGGFAAVPYYVEVLLYFISF